PGRQHLPADGAASLGKLGSASFDARPTTRAYRGDTSPPYARAKIARGTAAAPCAQRAPFPHPAPCPQPAPCPPPAPSTQRAQPPPQPPCIPDSPAHLPTSRPDYASHDPRSLRCSTLLPPSAPLTNDSPLAPLPRPRLEPAPRARLEAPASAERTSPV